MRANHKLLAKRNNGIEFFYNILMRLYITHSYWIWLSFIGRLFEWVSDHFYHFYPSFFHSLLHFLCIANGLSSSLLPHCIDDIPGYWVHYNGGTPRDRQCLNDTTRWRIKNKWKFWNMYILLKNDTNNIWMRADFYFTETF